MQLNSTFIYVTNSISNLYIHIPGRGKKKNCLRYHSLPRRGLVLVALKVRRLTHTKILKSQCPSKLTN